MKSKRFLGVIGRLVFVVLCTIVPVLVFEWAVWMFDAHGIEKDTPAVSRFLQEWVIGFCMCIGIGLISLFLFLIIEIFRWIMDWDSLV